jgi:teichuronic acid biosynthesis glycosyltransferase TuaC
MLGVPVVVGSIGSDLRRISDPVTQQFVTKTLRGASAVITVSEELRQRAIGFGVDPEKVTTILNGFDRKVFYPGAQSEARRSLRLDQSGELILYVGNLLKTKGVVELVKALAGLLEKRPNARLAMIGEGEHTASLQQLTAASGLQKRVWLLGRKDSRDVATWMRAADVFCLPSYSEGCPNVIVEALACGLPVVASDVGGIPELIRDEESGILVPPRDVERLCGALDEILVRSHDRARIAGTFSRSWEEVARETFDVCSRVMETVPR